MNSFHMIFVQTVMDDNKTALQFISFSFTSYLSHSLKRFRSQILRWIKCDLNNIKNVHSKRHPNVGVPIARFRIFCQPEVVLFFIAFVHQKPVRSCLDLLEMQRRPATQTAPLLEPRLSKMWCTHAPSSPHKCRGIYLGRVLNRNDQHCGFILCSHLGAKSLT